MKRLLQILSYILVAALASAVTLFLVPRGTASPLRADSKLEAIQDLTVLDNDGADLGNSLLGDLQTGGLNIESYVFIRKGIILD